MYMQLKRSSAKTFAVLTVCAFAIMLSGCGGVRALRNAQDAFNKAAEIDTRRLFGKRQNIQPVAELGKATNPEKPEIYYRAALDYLDSIDETTNKKSFQEDGLWSTKLMLEALCHWKLGHHDQARAIADEGARLAKETADPRDKVVLTIIPALIKIDQANAQADLKSPDEKKLKRLLLDKNYGARKHIDDARHLTTKRPDLEAYVIQVELSMYQVWDRAIGLESDEEKKVTNLLCDLYTKSKTASTEDRASALTNTWKRAFNVPFRKEECK